MDWLANNGEIYHRICTSWTASAQSGKCGGCGAPIPEATVQLAREQTADRDRRVRNQDLQRKTRNLTRRFAEMQSRTDATLAKTSSSAPGPTRPGDGRKA